MAYRVKVFGKKMYGVTKYCEKIIGESLQERSHIVIDGALSTLYFVP